MSAKARVFERRIYKFPTGAVIPPGAVYLSTVTQTKAPNDGRFWNTEPWVDCWLVWHYYDVQVEVPPC